MTIEATAQALATDEAQTAPQVADEAPAEISEEQELQAVWDELQSDDVAEKPQNKKGTPADDVAETDEPDSDEATEKSEGEATDADDGEEAEEDDSADPYAEPPTDMPKVMRDAWKFIPKDARAAIVERERKQGRQLAEQGRLVQGIKPIQDVLGQTVKDLPSLANMRPEDVAKEVMQLAKISNDFATKPVETMVSLIKQHRLEEPLRKLFAGQQPDQGSLANNQLQQEVQKLQRQLQQVSDPEYLRGQMEQFTTTASVQSSVEQFSQNAEHWNLVEEHMPNAIQYIKATSPDASPQDVLQEAYDLAVGKFVPNANKATQDSPANKTARLAADPEKTQAARKAKSVNIKSTATGNTRKLTEAEELARAYDKMQS